MIHHELLLEAKLADLDREFNAIRARNAVRRILRQALQPVEAAVMCRPTDLAAAELATNPWGEPGHGFIGRRREWLHELLGPPQRPDTSTDGDPA